jgi:guanylate kinase
MSQRGEFLEYAEVHGYLYGTSREATERILASGYDALLDIDVQGAAQIRRNNPESVTVFILPPSSEALYERLRIRNLNSSQDIERRLATAASEVLLFNDFDYVIVNDDLESAGASLESVIVAERLRPGRQRKTAEAIIRTFGGEPFHA